MGVQIIISDFICRRFFSSCYFTGSESNPDEDRLLKRLFDPDYQTHNLKTTPVSSTDEIMNVTVGIAFRKIITLVKPKTTLLVHCIVPCCTCSLLVPHLYTIGANKWWWNDDDLWSYANISCFSQSFTKLETWIFICKFNAQTLAIILCQSLACR